MKGRNRRKISRATAQKFHAMTRAQERFGIRLSRAKREGIVADIRAGKSIVVQKQNWRLTAHLMVVDNRFVKVIYDKSRGTLVTFLYPTEQEVKIMERMVTNETGIPTSHTNGR